jgi:N6-L-threonylcarbamoyladenine synthase
MEEVCRAHGRELYVPPLSLCGDNGLMVAAQGWFCYREGQRATTALNASAADF